MMTREHSGDAETIESMTDMGVISFQVVSEANKSGSKSGNNKLRSMIDGAFLRINAATPRTFRSKILLRKDNERKDLLDMAGDKIEFGSMRVVGKLGAVPEESKFLDERLQENLALLRGRSQDTLII